MMVASLLLAAHVSAAFIQTPGRPAAAGKPIVSKDGGFTAVAPCDPVRQPSSATSPSVLTMLFFGCDAGDFEVAVGMSEYVNLSPDSNLVFDGARAGLLKSIPQGKVPARRT